MNLLLLIYRKTKLTAQDNYTGVNQIAQAPEQGRVPHSYDRTSNSLVDTTVNLYYVSSCLLSPSDAADDLLRRELGARRS